MNKLHFMLLVLTISSRSFFCIGQGFEISVTLLNSQDSVVYLGHHFGTQRYVDDTAKVDNGKVIFKGDQPLIEGIYFYYTPSTYFEFLIGEQQFDFQADAKDVVNSAKFTNSPVNVGFYSMQRFTSEKRAKSAELQKQKEQTQDKETIAAYNQELKELNTEVLNFQKELQKEYPGSLLDRMISVMQTPHVPDNPEVVDQQLYRYLYYKDHFWDGIDIADPGLLRTPLLNSKVMDYLDNVIIQQPDSVIAGVDYVLQNAGRNPETFRFALITLANKYETSPVMGFDKVFVHIVDQYYLKQDLDWVDQETIDKLSERVASMKPNLIGNPAPNLVLWDTLGTEINLRDIDAKYTVLYFYDPDCGHCKTKTPILYASYPELQAKGVEILAVCTTTDERRWLEFIRENDLGWINIADLQAKTYFKFYYDVRSTPTVYILDKDKKILAKKIDVEQVEAVIDALIAQGE